MAKACVEKANAPGKRPGDRFRADDSLTNANSYRWGREKVYGAINGDKNWAIWGVNWEQRTRKIQTEKSDFSSK